MNFPFRNSLLAAIAILGLCSTAFSQAGKSGFAFLKVGVSGRGIAMADAMAASASGASAAYYNPAGILSFNKGTSSQIFLSHREWIQDTRAEFLGASTTLGEKDALGLSLNSTTVSDIEIRTVPGASTGTFTARSISLGISYSRKLSDVLQAGLTGKLLYEKIFVDEASGLAADLGVQYITSVEGLTAGAVLSNLGGVSKLKSENTTLPTSLRLGGAYTTDVASMKSTAMFAADFGYLFPGSQSVLSIGGEFLYDNLFAIRAGYQFGTEARAFSTGIGVTYGIAGFEYAFAPLSSDLGSTHTFALALHF